MVPERKTIDPQYIATQQQIFEASAQRWGQLYTRGQSIFSTGTDIIRRLTSRPTPKQELDLATADLAENRLNLSEARARYAALGAASDVTYRQLLSTNFSLEYTETGGQILATTQTENNNLGFLDAIYRANMGPFLMGVRVIGGGLLMAAGMEQPSQHDPITAAAMVEAGVFFAATGAFDIARYGLVSALRRSGDIAGNTTALIRRKASIHEGIITGDEYGDSATIDLELQTRMAAETHDRLRQDAIARPDLVNITDYSDILAQRASLRERAPRHDHISELIKSRDIARVSRLTRTLLYTALAVILIGTHLSRPEYCGTGNYVNPDEKIGAVTGTSDISSLRGLTQSMWFERIYNRPFDPENPQDRELFDVTYSQDPKGNDEIFDKIGQEIRRKNPGLQFVTRDLFRHGKYWLVCNPELNQAYK